MMHKNPFICGAVFGCECLILYFWGNLSILKSGTVAGCDMAEVLAKTFGIIKAYSQSPLCLVGLDDISLVLTPGTN